jgi:hypothetical protein
VVGGLVTDPKRASLITAKGRVPLEWKRINAFDVAVTLHSKPTHAADSVILLEFDAPPKGGGVRLISENSVTNQLLAFDAERHMGSKTGQDSGLSYADGKQNNYCVLNWTKAEQWISWEVRVDRPAVFDLSLNYAKVRGGEYGVRCGDWKSARTMGFIEGEVPRFPPTQVDQLGSLPLAQGVHRIMLHVTKVNGGEVFRPLELWLTPKKKSSQ